VQSIGEINVSATTGGLTSSALSAAERPNVSINNETPTDLTAD